ncbi:hypothetical protein CFP66_01915 [Pseudonocardia sp. MH-G8]|nr:hypothetical protein CFP66_01915 [Pseudonocardia sp. MH-G8]
MCELAERVPEHAALALDTQQRLAPHDDQIGPASGARRIRGRRLQVDSMSWITCNPWGRAPCSTTASSNTARLCAGAGLGDRSNRPSTNSL